MTSDLDQHGSQEIPPKRSSGQILRYEVAEAVIALERSTGRLLISSFSAGLDLGFSLFLMAVVYTLAADEMAPPMLQLLVASMYSFGFIFVVLGRSELFTEQTTLAVLPVLSGDASVRSLARLWGVVYVGNLLGAALVASLIAWVGPALGVIEPAVLRRIGHNMVEHSWGVILVSGLLAGWLMGLLSWLVAAGRDTISQIFIVWLVTAAIGLGELHHSVMGAIEVLGSLFAGEDITLITIAHFLLWTTVGNAVGGVFFVAILKHGQARPRSTKSDSRARQSS